MPKGLIRDRLHGADEQPAILWRGTTVSHAQLRETIGATRDRLLEAGIHDGSVVALLGDFSPTAIAAELALFELDCVVAPLRVEEETRHDELFAIAEAEWVVTVGTDDALAVRPTGVEAENRLLRDLGEDRRPGLILFSSGTSGVPNGIDRTSAAPSIWVGAPVRKT